MNIAALVNRSHGVNTKGKDYQELYEELKRNTSTFIKLVEIELSKVLAQHKKEKAWLQKENYRLRELLRNREQYQAPQCQTYRKGKVQRNSLQTYSFEQNAKDIINCGISDISVNQSKSILTDRKKCSILHFALQEKSQNTKLSERQLVQSKSGLKERSTLNLTRTLNSMGGSKENYTSSILPPDRSEDQSQLRERLSRQRGLQKNICKLGDKESVTDALKKIRQKAMTPKASNTSRQQPQFLQRDIIIPGMYSLTKKRF